LLYGLYFKTFQFLGKLTFHNHRFLLNNPSQNQDVDICLMDANYQINATNLPNEF
jgi:hypothetical protein